MAALRGTPCLHDVAEHSCTQSNQRFLSLSTLPWMCTGPFSVFLFVPSAVTGWLAYWQYERSLWKVRNHFQRYNFAAQAASFFHSCSCIGAAHTHVQLCVHACLRVSHAVVGVAATCCEVQGTTHVAACSPCLTSAFVMSALSTAAHVCAVLPASPKAVLTSVHPGMHTIASCSHWRPHKLHCCVLKRVVLACTCDLLCALKPGV